MSTLLPIAEILTTKELQPLGELTVRNKFVTGLVVGERGTFFLKAVREGMADSVKEDLRNEVEWDRYVQPLIDSDRYAVPAVEAVDDGGGWALFERLEGHQATEAELPELVGPIAVLAAAVAGVPLGREGTDLTRWYRTRLARFMPVLESGTFKSVDSAQFEAILNGETPIDILTAGIIHGDLNLKNLLVGERLGVPDAEFGTTPAKPERDKPRYHDIAYFYHLLQCQYHNEQLAETFLHLAHEQMSAVPDFNEDTFEAEFALSVLERTLSMASHFVVNPNPAKIIDDERRSEPEPYTDLVNSSLAVLLK